MRFLRWGLRATAVLVVLYAYFAALHPREKVADHKFFDRQGPWAIAHRGGRGLSPENTLVAMEKADALGADVLEMDLRVTADGVMVLMHDATVERTTNGSGRVDAMKLDEIRKLDAGYRFQDTSGSFPYRGKGVAVTTFEEVLSRFAKARLNVEMKGFTPDQAAKLCRLLREGGAMDRALVASVESESMSAFRKACPSVATSATMREGVMLYELQRARLVSLYRGPAVALQIPEYFKEERVVEPRFLELARAMNVRVQVWTVNEEADMKRLIDWGVQGILTDYPDRLLRVMGRRP